MSLLEKEKINITRVQTGTGDLVDGHWVEGPKDNFPDVLVNIQPVNGEDLLQLPEADRERVTYKIYSKTEIKNKDRITRTKDGFDYEIIQVKDWTEFRISHYRGMLVKENQQ